MSDCDLCVHTYRSGNCLLGCDQTFTTIENRVVNSSLEPDCPHFVLSGLVRDSSDSAKDLGDSAKDLGDSAKDSNNDTTDLDNDIKDSDNTTKDLSDKDNILFLLIGLKDIFFGVTVTSAIFYGLQEVPHLNFVTYSCITLLVICLGIYYRQRQLAAGGDDQ